MNAEHDDHGGLHRDVPVLVNRRDMVRMMGGLSLAGLLAACGVTDSRTTTIGSGLSSTTGATPATGAPTTGTPATGAVATSSTDTFVSETTPGAEIPDETAGPFPADGSNGPNLLDDEGIVRADITKSIGEPSGVADGVPIKFDLSIIDADTGSPIPAAVVYLWHCTADGRYSVYEVEDENFLRGVQVADETGRISFVSIFPGCYRGRWPHAHFEVYSSMAEATTGSAAIKISQLALPQPECEAVYADSRYGNSAQSLADLSLTTDNVFADGSGGQLAALSGSPSEGYTASLLVRV